MQDNKIYQNYVALKEVVDSLAENSADPEERRGSGRFPFHVTLSLSKTSDSGDTEQIGTVLGLDISYTGMAILTRTPLEPNTAVHVNLEPFLKRAFLIELVIVDCAEVVDGMYRVGGVFVFEEAP